MVELKTQKREDEEQLCFDVELAVIDLCPSQNGTMFFLIQQWLESLALWCHKSFYASWRGVNPSLFRSDGNQKAFIMNFSDAVLEAFLKLSWSFVSSCGVWITTMVMVTNHEPFFYCPSLFFCVVSFCVCLFSINTLFILYFMYFNWLKLSELVSHLFFEKADFMFICLNFFFLSTYKNKIMYNTLSSTTQDLISDLLPEEVSSSALVNGKNLQLQRQSNNTVHYFFVNFCL